MNGQTFFEKSSRARINKPHGRATTQRTIRDEFAMNAFPNAFPNISLTIIPTHVSRQPAETEIAYLGKLIFSVDRTHNRTNGIWKYVYLIHLVTMSVYGSIYSNVKDYETENNLQTR